MHTKTDTHTHTRRIVAHTQRQIVAHRQTQPVVQIGRAVDKRGEREVDIGHQLPTQRHRETHKDTDKTLVGNSEVGNLMLSQHQSGLKQLPCVEKSIMFSMFFSVGIFCKTLPTTLI